MATKEPTAESNIPYFNGMYRESAKYRTEWHCPVSGFDRTVVRRVLNRMINSDRMKGFYGSRIKIEKVFITKDRATQLPQIQNYSGFPSYS